jgi:hypothetical protein
VSRITVLFGAAYRAVSQQIETLMLPNTSLLTSLLAALPPFLHKTADQLATGSDPLIAASLSSGKEREGVKLRHTT